MLNVAYKQEKALAVIISGTKELTSYHVDFESLKEQMERLEPLEILTRKFSTEKFPMIQDLPGDFMDLAKYLRKGTTRI